MSELFVCFVLIIHTDFLPHMIHPNISEILSLFNDKGHSMYGYEPVSQLDHALQCASLAKNNNASDSLVTAALLHDIGHLLHDLPDESADFGIDDYHENLAYNFLSKYFIPDVSEPVRLHVQAKRYLCATESGYLESLSPASVQSLKLQGGVMTTAECSAFEESPWYHSAVALRRWDDEAKIQGLKVPPVEQYITSMQNSLSIA